MIYVPNLPLVGRILIALCRRNSAVIYQMVSPISYG